MQLEDLSAFLDVIYEKVTNPVTREMAKQMSLELFGNALLPSTFEESLPLPNERMAIVDANPKTASLLYDRVFYLRDPQQVHPSIRACMLTSFRLTYIYLNWLVGFIDTLEEGTLPEYLDTYDEDLRVGLHNAVICIAEAYSPDTFPHTENRITESAYKEVTSSWPEIYRRNVLEWHRRSILYEYGISGVPVFESHSSFDEAYAEGKREVIVTTLSNLGIIDESKLEWGQVLESRQDKDAIQDIRRIVHWFDSSFPGKSKTFIEDEICLRLYDFEAALKRHGIHTVLGSLSTVLDGKFMFGSATTSAGVAYLAQDPILGVLAEGLLVSGKILVHVGKSLLKYDEQVYETDKEIACIHSLRGKYGKTDS